ncbi:Six-hairpin glycosidase-like protein [Dimargaris cristalligena]|uniref:Trehalase n=1 Tax=Dimargaris cristalligena TaxID=215637 RepID=A0A4Q0A0Y4_9FUNG|nr:Six-hairpin glycosidase-like protein [Dimargaris cristalligena]|eukprot:RKP39715.1 Six-hairpin glycosidase-like protein [Dimargaris cristalligena]
MAKVTIGLLALLFSPAALAGAVASVPTAPLTTGNPTTPGCDNGIYCTGPILKAVQLSGIYKDSKTFVDMPTKRPESDVKAAFEKLKNPNDPKELQRFLDENFHEPGKELKSVPLRDYHPHVRFLDGVQNSWLRGWGQVLHNFWPQLTRQVDFKAICEGCVSSLIETPYPFVVPGGRFREYYYWDSYFTMEGLLESELFQTTKEMILNFLHIVKQKGFVPNGARIYYLNRSQPPLLTQMVRLYFEKTLDYEFLLEALPTLRQEYSFWEKDRSVEVKLPGGAGKKGEEIHVLSRYHVEVDQPRPEAYKEDIKVAQGASKTDVAIQHQIYSDLAAGAESGLDYTSRWTRSKDLPEEDILTTLETAEIVPVELNSILYLNERDLTGTDQRQALNFLKEALAFRVAADRRYRAMRAVLFEPKLNKFKDWNLRTGQRVTDFSLTDFWPLWAMPDMLTEKEIMSQHAEISKLELKYKGGLPTTLDHTGLQWDFPNVWPPLQYMVIRGIQRSYDRLRALYVDRPLKGLPVALQQFKDTELDLAQKYINNAFCAWYETGGELPGQLARKANVSTNDTGNMFEKFNAEILGRTGHGGEYDPQVGFGWTNGVAIWLLGVYGTSLQTPPCLVVSVANRR